MIRRGGGTFSLQWLAGAVRVVLSRVVVFVGD
jgi:hypothetical protein